MNIKHWRLQLRQLYSSDAHRPDVTQLVVAAFELHCCHLWRHPEDRRGTATSLRHTTKQLQIITRGKQQDVKEDEAILLLMTKEFNSKIKSLSHGAEYMSCKEMLLVPTCSMLNMQKLLHYFTLQPEKFMSLCIKHLTHILNDVLFSF